MKKKLLKNIIWNFILLTLMLVSMTVGLFFTGEVDLINENSLSKIQINSHIIYSYTFNSSSFLTKEDITQFLKDRQITDYTIIKNSDFSILDSTRIRYKITPKDYEMITLSLVQNSLQGELFSYAIENESIVSYLPALIQGEVFTIRIVSSFKGSRERLHKLYRTTIIAIVIMFALFIFFAVRVYYKLFKRLTLIYDSSHEIMNGNYNVFVHDNEEDEIHMLAETFNKMARVINNHVEEALSANPLSGLPGNILIEREIHNRIVNKEDFTVLYIDLDNFKSYNDKYGFQKGDDVLLYTKDVILKIKELLHNDSSIFLGHEGGDDYVIITKASLGLSFAEALANAFDSEINQFYDNSDKEQGFIISTDRDGKKKKFEFVACSIAIVESKNKNIHETAEIIELASKVKKKVKNRPNKKGSGYVLE